MKFCSILLSAIIASIIPITKSPLAILFLSFPKLLNAVFADNKKIIVELLFKNDIKEVFSLLEKEVNLNYNTHLENFLIQLMNYYFYYAGSKNTKFGDEYKKIKKLGNKKDLEVFWKDFFKLIDTTKNKNLLNRTFISLNLSFKGRLLLIKQGNLLFSNEKKLWKYIDDKLYGFTSHLFQYLFPKGDMNKFNIALTSLGENSID